MTFLEFRNSRLAEVFRKLKLTRAGKLAGRPAGGARTSVATHLPKIDARASGGQIWGGKRHSKEQAR